MKRLFFGGRKKAGQSPGTLVHVGEQKTEAVSIKLMEYDAKGYFVEKETAVLAELARSLETPAVTWINVAGLHQIEIMEAIVRTFGIHPLMMEDILNTNQHRKWNNPTISSTLSSRCFIGIQRQRVLSQSK